MMRPIVNYRRENHNSQNQDLSNHEGILPESGAPVKSLGLIGLSVWTLVVVLPCSLFGTEAQPPAAASSTLISLRDAESKALSNHPSVHVTREEVDVADFKRKEAMRSLFPTLSAKAENTRGDAVDPLGTPAFTERSYGLEASHTLYSGGRLHDTYRQAAATWESLKAKLRKTESDVIYGVRESAWNFIRAQRQQTAYEKALEDLSHERDMAERLFHKDAISREVHMQIISQYNQAEAALEGAQADVEARLWQWTAALGLQSPPAYGPDAGTMAVSTAAITLDDCLKLAEANNPDLVIQRKTAEAAFYGSKAGSSVYKPIVNLNGFYGRSGGAFDSEPLHLSEDWQAGIQISQYFSLNTLNLSGSEQHTSPKIGQSTRTASKTAAASIGILDGFKKKADAKDAALAFHQADVQKQRTELDVANGVREAFANWKKANARLKMAQNDFPLTQTGYAIARIKSAHRDVPLSERAIWRNRSAQSEATLEEAKATYQTAIAVLAHAIGMPDHFYR